MDNMLEPLDRSGGIDFDQSEVQAQDIIGRDKIELILPEIPRKGCYAQLSKNIKFVVSLGVLLFLIYGVFQQLRQPSVSQQTPTPTTVQTPTPTRTPEPVTTPTAGDRRVVQPTMTPVPPGGGAVTAVSPVQESPVVLSVTPSATVTVSPSPTATHTATVKRHVAAATATPEKPPRVAPVVRPPTPTVRPTPTPIPKPTATPRPPTPTPNPCPSATVRVGPAAKLVKVGDVFTVNVRISCAVKLAGYQVELRFDPAVVSVRSVGDGGFLGSGGGATFVAGPDVNNGAGKATIGAVVLRPGPFPSGSGTLASFTLEAVGPGSTDLGLGVSLSDVNGQPVPAGASSGAVIVEPPSTEATTTP
ncbi:MAG: hypothetical protein D6791_13075 [Chloroflexi bacterium]|nr:MAG: hypothetical protein D6791_13075 [Chloroflexota bacterium]